MNGDVLFLWNGDIGQIYDIQITKDKTISGWDRQTVTQYTVEDALLYDSISINVRLPGDSTYNVMTYSGKTDWFVIYRNSNIYRSKVIW